MFTLKYYGKILGFYGRLTISLTISIALISELQWRGEIWQDGQTRPHVNRFFLNLE